MPARKIWRRRIGLTVLAILCASAAFTLWDKSRKEDAASSTSATAKAEIPEFDPGDVKRITISWRDNSVDLSVKDGAWVLESRSGHPADFQKVSSMVKELSELKAAKTLDGCTEATIESLNLLESPPKGRIPAVAIRLYGAAGDMLFSILLGKGVFLTDADGTTSKTPSGRYALCPGANDETPCVFISSELFEDYPPIPRAWLKSPDIRLKDLKRMKVSPQKSPAWEAWRTAAKDAFAFTPPKNARLDLKKLSEALSPFASPFVLDAIPKGAMPDGFKEGDRLEVELEYFDGSACKLDIRSSGEKAWLTMDAGSSPAEWGYEMPVKLAQGLTASPEAEAEPAQP